MLLPVIAMATGLSAQNDGTSGKKSLNDINLFSDMQSDSVYNEVQKRNKDVNNEIIAESFSHASGFLPIIHVKENTQGSRYLFKDWGHGALLDSNGNIIYKSDNLYNYDKMANKLLLKMSENKMMELNYATTMAFKITDGSRVYFFEKVPLIAQDKYFVRLNTIDGRYEFVKQVKTVFEGANYQSTGIVESGHNYDLYMDTWSYYLVDVEKATYKLIDMKRRLIEKYFGEDSKATEYFKKHDSGPVDENFVIDMVNYLNDSSTK